MSQFNLPDFVSPQPGSTFLKDNLELWRDAVHSTHSGTTRPDYSIPKLIWVDDTSTPWVLKMFQGSDDIILGTLDPSTLVFTPPNIPDDSVTTDKIDDAAVTNAKLANMAQATIKGRAAGAGTGAPVDLSATQASAILAATGNGAAMVYRRDNILGTVSQSAGVPTGGVIERGSNANGTFVKFADGTMICETPASGVGAMDVNTASGSVFFSTTPAIWTFPAAFITAPKVSAQVGGSSTRWATAYSATTTQTTLRQYAGAAGAGSADTQATAIGRWF